METDDSKQLVLCTSKKENVIRGSKKEAIPPAAFSPQICARGSFFHRFSSEFSTDNDKEKKPTIFR
jgi:hypothetical protein